jgi:hypothetical protein
LSGEKAERLLVDALEDDLRWCGDGDGDVGRDVDENGVGEPELDVESLFGQGSFLLRRCAE